MKSKLLLTAAILFLVLAGSAQVSIGAQAGGVYSSPNISSSDILSVPLETKSRFNFKAGLIFDIPFGEDGWRFMPELKYVNKGYGIDLNTTFCHPGFSYLCSCEH